MHHSVHKKPKPHKTNSEPVIYFFAYVTPLFEIPQAVTIFVNRSAENVSAITWVYFLLDNIFWLHYGFRHRLKPLIITYILYTFADAAIVVGIFMYS